MVCRGIWPCLLDSNGPGVGLKLQAGHRQKHPAQVSRMVNPHPLSAVADGEGKLAGQGTPRGRA